MLKGTTPSGFKFKIDEDIRDDMELLEAITQIDSGDVTEMPNLLRILLGEEQKSKLYEHCRNDKGRVSATKVSEEIKAIFEEIEKGDSKTKN